MDTQVEPRTKSEPELNLLLKDSTLQQPLWISLFQNLNDFFFLKKLPPLVLTSKPVPLRTILGFYGYKKEKPAWLDGGARCSADGDYRSHGVDPRVVQPTQTVHSTVTLLSSDDILQRVTSNLRSSGGGGGGDRDKL